MLPPPCDEAFSQCIAWDIEHDGNLKTRAERSPCGIVEKQIIAFDQNQPCRSGDDRRSRAGDFDGTIEDWNSDVHAVVRAQTVYHCGKSSDIESVGRSLARTMSTRLQYPGVEMKAVHRENAGDTGCHTVEAGAKPLRKGAFSRSRRAGDGNQPTCIPLHLSQVLSQLDEIDPSFFRNGAFHGNWLRSVCFNASCAALSQCMER